MSRVAPARRAAYAALRAVISGRADLPEALDRSRKHLADDRDQALAAEVATGTLRWMGALDAVIAAFGDRDPSRLDPEVLDALRLGAYQLLHLDRVPARAVVDDGVELVREAGKQSATGFVNALLRRIDRERGRLPLPARPAGADHAAALDYLAVTLSHPSWLVDRWLRRVGFDAAEAWARFDNAPAPMTLRVNTMRIGRDALASRLAAHGVTVSPAKLAPDGLVVTGGNPLRTPLAAEGAFLVQDEASQLVALAVGARPGERILDVCAAPGGKTVALAAAAGNRGVIVAGDVRARRVALLRETLLRTGAESVRVARFDARASLPFGSRFDAVLLDAPCSGLGTIRRDPEIRWRRSPHDLVALADTQRLMLERAAVVVAPGGRLVYATCSSEPDENEDVVGAFLADHREFSVERPGTGAAAVLEPVVGSSGYLRTWPHVHGLEAFFAAVLRRHA
jgi:16S rRNA (cytosine967-C5)-methyltransferase